MCSVCTALAPGITPGLPLAQLLSVHTHTHMSSLSTGSEAAREAGPAQGDTKTGTVQIPTAGYLWLTQ